jgi:hypothetical protein
VWLANKHDSFKKGVGLSAKTQTETEDNKYPWQRKNPRLFDCILDGVTVLPEEEILQACTGD